MVLENEQIQEGQEQHGSGTINTTDTAETQSDDSPENKSESIEQQLEQGLTTQQQEVAMLKDKIKELNDTILRQYADTDNLRKRYQRELEDMSKYAVTEFARDLLEIFENIYRAKSHIEPTLEQDERVKSMFEGLDMTTKLLENMWRKHGITRLYPEGEEFDHDSHQAISHSPTPDKPNNTVVNVIQAGYKLKDRLLRPALVIIAKND